MNANTNRNRERISVWARVVFTPAPDGAPGGTLRLLGLHHGTRRAAVGAERRGRQAVLWPWVGAGERGNVFDLGNRAYLGTALADWLRAIGFRCNPDGRAEAARLEAALAEACAALAVEQSPAEARDLMVSDFAGDFGGAEDD